MEQSRNSNVGTEKEASSSITNTNKETTSMMDLKAPSKQETGKKSSQNFDLDLDFSKIKITPELEEQALKEIERKEKE